MISAGDISDVPHAVPISDWHRNGFVPYEYINFLFPQNQSYDDFLIIVEKRDQQAALYRFIDGFNDIELMDTYHISTGKAHGNKLRRGDLKTPEGLYIAHDFMSERTLRGRYGAIAAQYGTGAWELGYPNELDKLRRKTGSGIWVHGTDIDMTPFDTEGCVRFENDIITYFHETLNFTKTPIIINEVIQWVGIDFLKKEIDEIQSFIADWKDSWINQDIDKYLTYYCFEEFVSYNQNMNYTAWENHKRRLFNPHQQINIDLHDFNFYYADDLLLVTFYQDYSTSTVNDFGRKQLVLKRDSSHVVPTSGKQINSNTNRWKIVQEEWTNL